MLASHPAAAAGAVKRPGRCIAAQRGARTNAADADFQDIKESFKSTLHAQEHPDYEHLQLLGYLHEPAASGASAGCPVESKTTMQTVCTSLSPPSTARSTSTQRTMTLLDLPTSLPQGDAFSRPMDDGFESKGPPCPSCLPSRRIVPLARRAGDTARLHIRLSTFLSSCLCAHAPAPSPADAHEHAQPSLLEVAIVNSCNTDDAADNSRLSSPLLEHHVRAQPFGENTVSTCYR